MYAATIPPRKTPIPTNARISPVVKLIGVSLRLVRDDRATARIEDSRRGRLESMALTDRLRIPRPR